MGANAIATQGVTLCRDAFSGGLWVEVLHDAAPTLDWAVLHFELREQGVEILDPDEMDAEWHDEHITYWCAYIDGEE